MAIVASDWGGRLGWRGLLGEKAWRREGLYHRENRGCRGCGLTCLIDAASGAWRGEKREFLQSAALGTVFAERLSALSRGMRFSVAWRCMADRKRVMPLLTQVNAVCDRLLLLSGFLQEPTDDALRVIYARLHVSIRICTGASKPSKKFRVVAGGGVLTC